MEVMDLHLTDKVAFVAGSSRGIGRGIAEALLSEGARVVITGRDRLALDAAFSNLSSRFTAGRIMAISGDFSNEATISAGFKASVERFGRIDHLIANLGTGSGKPGWDQSTEEWNRLFELNFFAATRLTRQVLPLLLANEEKGSILFVSSIVAIEATPAPLPYSAAKAALNNYAKNLARQLAPHGIRVNTIAPGNIFFPGGSWERHMTNRREDVQRMLKTEVPMQRFGIPEEIASFSAFLCSPHAGFATGSCFVVDGGQTRSL
jgi:3-oxoacyl-[acyl-carrier protein] reductase